MKTIKLHTGDNLPTVGFGLWKVEPETVGGLVEHAVRGGYRHLDCACDYGNEADVGKGIANVLQQKICTREELWITSKLFNTYHRAEHVRAAVEKSLMDLQLDYLDLYLIHFPISLKYVPIEHRYPPGWLYDPDVESPKMELSPVPIQETWQAMEELVESGLVKNIGISNFGTSLIRDLLSYAKIRPSVLQIESHPYLTQEKLLRYAKQENIAVTAYSPLGALSYISIGMAEQRDIVLEQPVVQVAARHHGKTAAQIVLRWGIQRGNAIVPKSSRPERLDENIALFDFELSDAEMRSISALNCNHRFNDPGVFGEEVFNTFCPIYE